MTNKLFIAGFDHSASHTFHILLDVFNKKYLHLILLSWFSSFLKSFDAVFLIWGMDLHQIILKQWRGEHMFTPQSKCMSILYLI